MTLSAAGLAICGCTQRPSNYTAGVADSVKDRSAGGTASSTLPPPPPRRDIAGAQRRLPVNEGKVHLNQIEQYPSGGHNMTPRGKAAFVSRNPRPILPPQQQPHPQASRDPFLVAQASPGPAAGTKPPQTSVAVPPRSIQQGVPSPARIAQAASGTGGGQVARPPIPQPQRVPAPVRFAQAAPPTAGQQVTRPSVPQQPAGVARTKAPAPQATPQPALAAAQPSRLEQLRSQLRTAAAVDARPASAAPPVSPDRNDRGVLLSDGRPAAHADAAPAASVESSPAGPRATDAAAAPAEAAPAEQLAPPERVQSLLAAAEWQIEQGDLQQAYRNAIVAQRLMDQERVVIAQGERRPVDVARKVWRLMHEQSKPAAGSTAPEVQLAAQQEPVEAPADAFPAGRGRGWQAAELPQVRPLGSAPVDPQVAAAPPPPPVDPATPSAPDLSPVSLASIEGQAEPHAPRAAGGVVTAVAEVETSTPLNAPQASDATYGQTVPAMATFPRWDDRGPLNGPALTGPSLVPPQQIAPPPSLDVIGTQRLPEIGAESPTPGVPSGSVWGVAGLIAGVLVSAFAFRRRWSDPAPQSR
jgi:hypothetical protein